MKETYVGEAYISTWRMDQSGLEVGVEFLLPDVSKVYTRYESRPSRQWEWSKCNLTKDIYDRRPIYSDNDSDKGLIGLLDRLVLSHGTLRGFAKRLGYLSVPDEKTKEELDRMIRSGD